jgi:hypothetical protein
MKGWVHMRQGLILTGLGVAMWAIGTLFFLLFGDWVVLEVNDPYFGSSLFLLEMLTFLLLIGIAVIVRLKLFREKGSATRFGYIAAVVGLLLSTPTLWYRDSVFRGFTEGQHQGFTVWMTLACALTLIVPAIVDRFVREPETVVEVSIVEAPLAKEASLSEDQPLVELEHSTPPTESKVD